MNERSFYENPNLTGHPFVHTNTYRLMQRRARCALALSLPLLLAACQDSQPSVPQGQPGPVPVSVVTLESGAVTLTRELPGRTRAYEVAEVRPQVSGIVRERLFTEGSEVKAGDPLYQLDDETYRANWRSARASVARAEAGLEVAQLNAGRASELVKTKAVSDQEYRNLLATEKQAEADLEYARAQLASAKVPLDYARITSPITGRVGKSTVTQGALVTADQATALTTVHRLDPIYVDVTQSATELLNLRRSLSESALKQAGAIPVAILLEDGSRYPIEGELTFADAAVDPTTGSVAMRIVVPNPDRMLLPGMYVRALVSNAILEDGLLVPQRGIQRDPKGNAFALVVNDEGMVEQRAVDVGGTMGDNWLVRGGLSEGDRVIVEGLQKVRPGAPVDATPFQPSPDGES